MADISPKNLSVEEARVLVQATTFDIFNERDQAERRRLMEQFWAPDVTCYSPFGASTGYDAMDQLWDGQSLLFS